MPEIVCAITLKKKAPYKFEVNISNGAQVLIS